MFHPTEKQEPSYSLCNSTVRFSFSPKQPILQSTSLPSSQPQAEGSVKAPLPPPSAPLSPENPGVTGTRQPLPPSSVLHENLSRHLRSAATDSSYVPKKPQAPTLTHLPTPSSLASLPSKIEFWVRSTGEDYGNRDAFRLPVYPHQLGASVSARALTRAPLPGPDFCVPPPPGVGQ